MSEELLDVLLVPVRRANAHGALQAKGAGEALHGPGRRVAVVEAGGLEPAGVGAPAVAEELQQLGGQLDADQAEGRRGPFGGDRRHRREPLAAYGGHLAPGEPTVPGDVEDAGDAVVG